MKGRLKQERKDSLKGLLVLLTIFFVVVGCFGPSFAQKVESVKIGIIEPLSGSLALIGDKNLKGYQLAIKRINDGGGIKSLGGAQLIPIIGDSEGKPEVP